MNFAAVCGIFMVTRRLTARWTKLKAPLMIAALVAVLSALGLSFYEGGSGGVTEQKAAREGRDQQRQGASQAGGSASSNYGPPVVLAHLEDQSLKESSGVAASRVAPGVFWTHNDTRGGPVVHAFDRQGKSRGAWHVAGASVVDWEDIHVGPGPRGRPYLYVGDIGDNDNTRAEVIVYRFPEPAVAESAAAEQRETEAAESVTLKFPDGPRDAETLLVHPRTGDIYVINKTKTEAAGVYKLRAPKQFSGTHTLERVGSISRQGMIGKWFTGGDISPDGRRVALCDDDSGYELELPAAGADFDQIWKQPLVPVNLGQRKQGEGVSYSHDGSSILATSEKLPTPLIEVPRSSATRK